MDGRGRWIDNVFVEATVEKPEVRGGVSESLRLSCRGQARDRRLFCVLQWRRRHQGLGDLTLDAVYFGSAGERLAAWNTGIHRATGRPPRLTRRAAAPWINPAPRSTTYRPHSAAQTTGTTSNL
jgi:hypothetical protein